MSDELMVPADEAFPVLAHQHRRRLSEAFQVRTRLVASKAIRKAYAGPGGRTCLTVDDLTLITLGMAGAEAAVHAPDAVRVYPFLESFPAEVLAMSAHDGEEPSPLALWLRDETHELFEAVSALFTAAAQGEISPAVDVRLEVNRAAPAAQLTFRDKRSGVAFSRIYAPPLRSTAAGFFAPLPGYDDSTVGTSIAYRLHREYFAAIGDLLRKHQEKAAAEPRPGRRRQVDREAPGNYPRGVKNKPTPPDGQPTDLPHPKGLVQQERASCRRGLASRRPHAV